MSFEQELKNKLLLEPKNKPLKAILEMEKELNKPEVFSQLTDLELDICQGRPIKSIKGSYTLKVNPLSLAIIKGNNKAFSKLLKKYVNKKDDFGHYPIEYASMLEDVEMFNQLSKESEHFEPILGTKAKFKDSKFLNNFNFDKISVVGATNFLLYSPYNFLEDKNLQKAIKKIYPEAGKKTFKLLSQFSFQNNTFNADSLHFLHFCKIYLENVNHLNEVLENVESIDFFKEISPLHFILERMSETRFKNFIIDVSKIKNNQIKRMIDDTMSQYKEILRICHDEYEINFKAIDSLKKLHDNISEDYRRISRHGENMILFLERKFPFLADMAEEEFNNLKIIIPQDKATLIDWGEKLGNCIGGYGSRARDGGTIIFALYEGDKVRYNIEMSPDDGRIRQFVSNSNVPVEAQLWTQLQEFINKHFNGVNLGENEDLVRLPVDRRFMVRVLKANTPVDEEKSFLNNLFMFNISPKVQTKEFLDTSHINGFEENIPRGSMSLVLEDKNSKGLLLERLAKEKESCYAGLLKQFKKSSHLKIKEKDFLKIPKEIEKQQKEGYKNFFIGLNRMVVYKNKNFPSAVTSKDLKEFEKLITPLLKKNINVFLVVDDLNRVKNLKYNLKDELDEISHQIFFTHRANSFDNNLKVDVIKNIYGAKDCRWNIKV